MHSANLENSYRFLIIEVTDTFCLQSCANSLTLFLGTASGKLHSLISFINEVFLIFRGLMLGNKSAPMANSGERILHDENCRPKE
jgi:hypothetical protein